MIFSPNSGKLTRRGSSDAATEMESLSARHSHSHHTLVSDLPDHSNSHGENTVKEGGSSTGSWARVRIGKEHRFLSGFPVLNIFYPCVQVRVSIAMM